MKGRCVCVIKEQKERVKQSSFGGVCPLVTVRSLFSSVLGLHQLVETQTAAAQDEVYSEHRRVLM